MAAKNTFTAYTKVQAAKVNENFEETYRNKGEYDSDADYTLNDVVTVGEIEWRAKRPVSGVEPVAGDDWARFGSGDSSGTGDVSGPASAVADNIAIFSGTSGKIIKDSGKALPSGNLVGTTATQNLTNKTLTSPTLSNPSLTGTATAPTPATDDNSTKIATTAFVNNLLGDLESGVVSVNGETGVVEIDKSDLGLGNVDNTSDLDKPVSNATQTQLDSKIDASEKGMDLGVATLDATGKVPLSQLPDDIGGGITTPAETVVGNIATWDSETGEAIADSGTPLENLILLASRTEVITQAAHGFEVNQFLKSTGTGSADRVFSLALADTAENAEVVGFVSEVIDENTFKLSLTGSLITIEGLDNGAYWLSDTEAGGYRDTPPPSGTISKVLFVVHNVTYAVFVNWQGVRIDEGLKQVPISGDYALIGDEDRIDADASDNSITITLPTPTAAFWKKRRNSIGNVGDGDNVAVEGEFTNNRTSINPIGPGDSLEIYVTRLKDGVTYKWHSV